MIKRFLTCMLVIAFTLALCSCGTTDLVVPTNSLKPEPSLLPNNDSGETADVVNFKSLSEMDDLEIVSGKFRDYVDSKGIDDTDYIYDDTFDYVESMPADTSNDNLKISFCVIQANYETYTSFAFQADVTGRPFDLLPDVTISDGITTVNVSGDELINMGTETAAKYCFDAEILDPESDYFESEYYSDIVKIFQSGNEITVTVTGANTAISGTVSDTVREDFEFINDIYSFNRLQYLK